MNSLNVSAAAEAGFGLARRLVPAPARAGLRQGLAWANRCVQRWRTELKLRRMRRRFLQPDIANTLERVDEYTLRIHDGPVSFILYKDVFINRLYHFTAQRPDPLILDCGSNVGLSILYFKHVYPRARLLGFEPDPVVFPYLEENMARNGLTQVQLVKAALANRADPLVFYSDGKWGSTTAEHLPQPIPAGWTKHEVPCVRLRDYLTEPVDFLKINIEGAEWEVLADSEDRLSQVREMVVEYHHFPGMPRTLHLILDLLHRRGFEYVVSDFGLENYGRPRPPARLHAETRYVRHLYARQL